MFLEVTHFHGKRVLISGTCFPHLLQYLLEGQMTDGYDPYLLVMMDCILQALLMISKYVNYSLTYLLLSFKHFLSSFYFMKIFLRLKKKKKAFCSLVFNVSFSREDLGRCWCVLKHIDLPEQYPYKLKIMHVPFPVFLVC